MDGFGNAQINHHRRNTISTKHSTTGTQPVVFRERDPTKTTESQSQSSCMEKPLQYSLSFLQGWLTTHLKTITTINDAATIVSAVGLILTEDFLLVKAAKLTTSDSAIGTRPMAGNGLAVTTPDGIKRARAGIKAIIVVMRRARSDRPLGVPEGLTMMIVCIWTQLSSVILCGKLLWRCDGDEEMS
jgi:hypothetical protein